MRQDTATILEPRRLARKGHLRVSEFSLLVFLTGMSVLAWVHRGQVPLSVRSSYITIGVLFAVAALALGEPKQGWRYWARELLPVPVVPFIFLSLGRLIPLVNPNIYDRALLACDKAILGPEMQAALYNLPLPAWWADLLTLAYSTYFFLAVALVVALICHGDPHLPRVAAAVVITFLVSYAGYFVVPAYGPRTTAAQGRYASLPTGLVGDHVRDLLDHWETTKTDAFPSGHTMVTLAVLYCARRRLRPLYNVLLPIGTLLIAATILLTYHYVVDVLAAVPLTVASLGLSAVLAGPVPTSAWAEGRAPRGEG